MKSFLGLTLFCFIGVLFAHSVHNPAPDGGPQIPQPTVRLSLVNSNLSSATLLNGMAEHCPGVTLTLDAKKADYSLEAQQQSAIERGNYGVTLFNKNGDAVFSTVTVKQGAAMKDMCDFINKVTK